MSDGEQKNQQIPVGPYHGPPFGYNNDNKDNKDNSYLSQIKEIINTGNFSYEVENDTGLKLAGHTEVNGVKLPIYTRSAHVHIYPQPAPKKSGVEIYSFLPEILEGTSGQDNQYLQTKLRERYEFGKNKYGQALMTGDGRDTGRDIEEEALDAIYYMAKAVYNKTKCDNAISVLDVVSDMVKKYRRELTTENPLDTSNTIINTFGMQPYRE